VFKTDASTPEPPSEPKDYVVDLAHIIGSDISAQLNAILYNFEQRTTAQMLVLTVQSQAVIKVVSVNDRGIVLDTSRFQHFSKNEDLWSTIKGIILVLLPIALVIYILRLCPVQTI
jgi:hypothetical protein